MELHEIFYGLPEIAQIALVIIGIIFAIKFIKFLFTNWFISRILSLAVAAFTLMNVISLGDNLHVGHALPLGILCAISYMIWFGPSLFTVQYESVDLGVDSFGNSITFVRETGGFLIAVIFTTVISYAINYVLLGMSGGKLALVVPVILIIMNLRGLFSRR